MTTPAQAAQLLEAALRTVEGLRVYRDRGASVDPPAAIVGLPQLGWQAHCGPVPTHARFRIDLVVPADELANERLWRLIPLVAEALEAVQSATLAPVEFAASPAMFTVGRETQLPGYEIQVDFAL